MIESSAVNKTMENASAFTRSFPSKAEGIALCSTFILSSVLIIAGNLLTLVLFTVTKPLRRKSLFLVINMAFADLLLGTFSVPFYIYFAGDAYQLWTAKSGFYPMVFGCIDAIFMLGSYLSTAFISCERLYTVYCVTPITVHQNIPHRHFHTLDMRCLVVCNITFAIGVYFS